MHYSVWCKSNDSNREIYFEKILLDRSIGNDFTDGVLGDRENVVQFDGFFEWEPAGFLDFVIIYFGSGITN